MFFKQLFEPESCTYTFLIADLETKQAAFIDPVDTQVDLYIDLLNRYGLTLKYSLETHVHADHVTGSGLLREKLGCKTAVGALCGAKTANIQIQDNDVFELSENESITAIATPGHTGGSVSYLWRDRVFTGDALLIDGCGRTDFQSGDPATLYDSITQRLFTLPDDTLVYPGHDYKGRWVSNIMQERTNNSRLAGKTKEEFIEIMNNLNLPHPKLIDIAVPANRYCGSDEETAFQAADEAENVVATQTEQTTLQGMLTEAKQNINEVTPEKAQEMLKNTSVCLIDVREESEFSEAYIDNAHLIPRGQLEFKIDALPELENKAFPILLYCRSGNRSALAAESLQSMGYSNVLSMTGGFEAWKQLSH
jgi:glyoxylase-like metal-dependent hydrolase (beta-lactamase superfamily II)/rhodanese-related sulfurtransferase